MFNQDCIIQSGKQIGTYPGLKIIQEIPNGIILEKTEQPYHEINCTNSNHDHANP